MTKHGDILISHSGEDRKLARTLPQPGSQVTEYVYIGKTGGYVNKKKKYTGITGIAVAIVTAVLLWGYKEYREPEQKGIPLEKINPSASLVSMRPENPGKSEKSQEPEKKKNTPPVSDRKTSEVKIPDRGNLTSKNEDIDATFVDGFSTDFLKLASLQANMVSYSGKVGGYIVLGEMKYVGNGTYRITSGEISGILKFDSTRNLLGGNLLVKDMNFPHPVNLVRKKRG